jgi:hypothetical protein
MTDQSIVWEYQGNFFPFFADIQQQRLFGGQTGRHQHNVLFLPSEAAAAAFLFSSLFPRPGHLGGPGPPPADAEGGD